MSVQRYRAAVKPDEQRDGNVLQGNFRTVGTSINGRDFTVGKADVEHLNNGFFSSGKRWKCGVVYSEGLANINADLIVDYRRIDG